MNNERNDLLFVIFAYPGMSQIPLVQYLANGAVTPKPLPSQHLLRPLSQVLMHSILHLFLQWPWHVDTIAINKRMENGNIFIHSIVQTLNQESGLQEVHKDSIHKLRH